MILNLILKETAQLNITQNELRLEKRKAETNNDGQWLQLSVTQPPGRENKRPI